jgi:hypothetical protein
MWRPNTAVTARRTASHLLRTLCPDDPPEAAELLDYFDSTYINGRLRQQNPAQNQAVRLVLRRRPGILLDNSTDSSFFLLTPLDHTPYRRMGMSYQVEELVVPALAHVVGSGITVDCGIMYVPNGWWKQVRYVLRPDGLLDFVLDSAV